ncbi:hypothetical protein VB715_18815 [Crocosphaera sp. UHCC 0190]|uniref:hypothetical protein n=1 Tax=Crocosphaera sp. UHCC 0190 TaxID=3110246 RepID=UPI002B1FA91A|nr:hypothetical protein [Crocosphaera sp. UHCC 0190]MEA5511828.1 hypothetical protein [Crocosphaera sp. UHCC 0190]
MAAWYYTARKKFAPSTTSDWQSYLNFSGFHHISELVSADSILCPNLVTEIIDSDWNHNVHEDLYIDCFLDFDYLKKRINFDPIWHNLLAIWERPTSIEIPLVGFEQCGFDLLDSYNSISVLTNCGQFPQLFKPDSVNRYGLFDDLSLACQSAEQLRNTYPEDPHCQDCRVWQITRYVNSK